MRIPVIDLECCVICEVCIDLAPHAFQINDAGFVEIIPLKNYSDQSINEAVNNCPRTCISWD